MTTELTPSIPTVACDELAQTLSAYQQSEEDLRVYRDKAARAQADEEAALTSEVLPEDEIAKRMGKAQNLKAVYATRIERKQADQARLTKELEASHQLAVRELNAALNDELDKRRGTVSQRLLAALDVGESLTVQESLSLPQATDTLVEFSQDIRAISSLRVNIYWGSPGDGAAISAAASALLSNLEQFRKLTSL